MKIKVDTREKELHTAITRQCVNDAVSVESSLLAVGDVIICDAKDNVLIIVERKTLRDLSGSIKDGRYKEQSFRLGECGLHRHNIMYLVEGSISSYQAGTFGVSRTTVMHAIVSLLYCEGFTVFFCQNTQESAGWIVALVEKLIRCEPSFYVFQQTITTYESVIQKTKRSHITLENIDVFMLAQIPGVSVATARAIMDAGYNLQTLLVAMTKDVTILNNIQIVTKTNKHRKIGKTASDNIRRYLHIGGNIM